MKDFYSEVRDVRQLVWRMSFVYADYSVGVYDAIALSDILIYQYILLKDLLPDPTEPCRRFAAFLGMRELDIKRFGLTLKYCDSYLKNSINRMALGESETFHAFKQRVKDAGLYSGLLSPVKELIANFFSNQDPKIFRLLSTWFNFPSRLNLRELDMSSAMEKEYLQAENDMLQWEYPMDILSDLNRIMRRWLRDFSYEELIGKHGPGSIAGYKGKMSLLQKYQLMTSDVRLDYLYKKVIGRPFEESIPCPLIGPLDRTSELVCVPKSILTNRTISKEPGSLQYAQQGVLRAIDIWLRNHTYLRNRIDLHDQTKSQDLARLGSVCGSYATIDLSNASDSVTFPLVKAIFRGTALYRALICTRSDATLLPSGIRVTLQKFAPMGSALCFPIETLIFAAICELASQRIGRILEYRVFGDDIIIDGDLTETVLEILSDLNFSVNKTKSFTDVGIDNFREACGGEYFNGVDVTPLRISRKYYPYDDRKPVIESAERVDSYVSLANNAFDAGFYNLRRAILLLFRDRYPHYRELIRDTNGHQGLCTFEHVDKNFQLPHRSHRSKTSRLDFQRREVLARASKSIEDVDTLHFIIRKQQRVFLTEEDTIRYFEWHRQKASLVYNDQLVYEPLIVRPVCSVMDKRWIYLSDK